MKIGAGFLAVFAILSVGAEAAPCPPNRLTVSDPQTQQNSCLERWIPQEVILVTEVECPPCEVLLKRMRVERETKAKEKLTIVWVETHPNRCLLEAQKFGALGRNVCTSPREVEHKWAVSSTPTVFWTQKGVPRVQKGVIDTDKPLPWLIP